MNTIRIGSRESKLAVIQSELVMDAIRAALDPQPDPEAEDAYFFVTDLTGRYYYAHTLAQHQANVRAARAVNAGL